jgi:hypothetical protein
MPELYLLALAQFAIVTDTEVVRGAVPSFFFSRERPQNRCDVLAGSPQTSTVSSAPESASQIAKINAL